jgi:hypothetical protein
MDRCLGRLVADGRGQIDQMVSRTNRLRQTEFRQSDYRDKVLTRRLGQIFRHLVQSSLTHTRSLISNNLSGWQQDYEPKFGTEFEAKQPTRKSHMEKTVPIVRPRTIRTAFSGPAPPPHGTQILHANRAINKVEDASAMTEPRCLIGCYQSGVLFRAHFVGSAKWFRW